MNLTTEDKLLMLKALSPGTSVKYSEYTHKWYVESGIDIGNGSCLTGVAVHQDSPNDAVDALFDRLITLGSGEYIASMYRGLHRREWRWNGAAFAEVTRDEALPEPRRSVFS